MTGVPVATVAIGNAKNAGLLAVQMLAAHDADLLQKVLDYKAQLAEQSRAKNDGFELLWRESGGPKVTVPRQRGFGSVAIEHNLARALDADVSLDCATEGVSCRILVPRSQLAAKS